MDYLKQIKNYKPYNEQEQADKKQILYYASIFNDLLTRENKIAHFSASSFIFNKTRDKILFIYNNIYKAWTWTGGHADGEDNFLNVALREAKEETGLKSVKPIINDMFTLEILPVWGHIKRGKYVVAHQHINVTYIFEADEKEELHIKEDENSGVKWIKIDEIKKYSDEKDMYPYYDKILDKMKKLRL